MHTVRTIGLIASAIALAACSAVAALVMLAGAGIASIVTLLAAASLLAAYRWVIGPWHRRWGTEGDEASRRLPADGLLPDAAQTTRAIGVHASPEAVWPWIAQIGWGRAGWYSYDWIDNDGRPSATTIVPELQQLDVGDEISMIPGTGFIVLEVEPDVGVVAQAGDGTTWCLRLVSNSTDECRLLSRFRAPARPAGLAARVWMLLADPGAFVMERRMLLGIRDRAERAGEVLDRAR